jgi:hypothetical protein
MDEHRSCIEGGERCPGCEHAYQWVQQMGEPYLLDIGPIAGDELLGSLLVAIGACGLESATVVTNGGRVLCIIAPHHPDLIASIQADRAELRVALEALKRAAEGDSNDREIDAGHDVASVAENLLSAIGELIGE